MKDEALQARTHDILGIRFDLTTYNAVMQTIERRRVNGKSHHVTSTNQYYVTLCHLDTKMCKAIEMAGMTLPDGMGIVLATPRFTTVPLEMLSTSESAEITLPTISSRKRPSLKTWIYLRSKGRVPLETGRRWQL